MPRDSRKVRDRARGDKRGDRKDRKGAWMRRPRVKVCQFCREKAEGVDYKDTQLLRKFISDRGKIRARRVTGACTQHQRDIATAIKNAREMALLPYMSR
jgi:small subunit ribosomal protein S18